MLEQLQLKNIIEVTQTKNVRYVRKKGHLECDKVHIKSKVFAL